MRRAADYGIRIGTLPTGALNKISDVSGVTVGHSTVRSDGHNTGVTVIMPSEANIFAHKLVAASYVHNGFGKTIGTVQIDELGTLETPIALTNTLNVGIVADSMIEYMIGRCAEEGVPLYSINPVVGECNDSMINDIKDRAVRREHVMEAIASARADFDEGDIGAGTGTQCYGLKGGIGSASRVIELDGKKYTVGILVQSNYGSTKDLIINSQSVGQQITEWVDGAECDRGSIIVILACDVPLSARQLKRVIKRCSVGIARLGSYIGHGSGEVFIGFSTANVISPTKSDIISISCINERCIDKLFRAAGEATEEAILNSMLCADEVRAYNGKALKSLKDFMKSK